MKRTYLLTRSSTVGAGGWRSSAGGSRGWRDRRRLEAGERSVLVERTDGDKEAVGLG